MTRLEVKMNAVTEEAVVILAKEMYDKELHHLPFRDARHYLREIYLSRARETLEKKNSVDAVCTCWITDESTWTRYVEPDSQVKANPDCSEHFPNHS